MTISENLIAFHDLAVVDFEPGEPLPDLSRSALRLAIRYDGDYDDLAGLWAQFLAAEGIDKTIALVIGNWANPENGPTRSQAAVELIVAGADRLPNLKALFLGDITSEENEISWIEQSDVSVLWAAYPDLEELGIRGGNRLDLGRVKHAKLKKLCLEAGGLPRGVVQSVASADLPELEHLELWLGTPDYGGDSQAADLAGILDGTRFPKLATLALRNCQWADDLATIVATAPIMKRIKCLDLSMGALGDRGVDAIVASPFVKGLARIDIAHHYVSDAGIAKLKALGISVDAEDRREPDTYRGEEYRYIAVSE